MVKSKSISVLPKASCTGCKMCGDICPKGCISYAEDNEGFFYPQVDNNTCIECGLCSKTCPALNVKLYKRADFALSAFSTNEAHRASGSSGGVFASLASYILDNGGIVYGASFDKHLKLHHACVERKEDLLPLCKSKYLQSDCTGVFRSVKTNLKQGRKVLFVGTPCQVQALKNYVGTEISENLFLVDFVCHGVPNQKLFDANLRWNEKKYGRVKSIIFRYKEKKVLHPQTLKMSYMHNGKEKSILRMHYQDPYYFGFQKHLTLRPSCYQCQWAKTERCADITLSDFWGIEKANIGLDSKRGVSCLLINTEKGQALFNHINNKLIGGVISLPLDFAVENNGCLQGSTIKPKNRDQFFDDWEREGYDAVVKKHLVSKRKWMFDLYYAIPTPIRKLVRILMDKRMKYE